MSVVSIKGVDIHLHEPLRRQQREFMEVCLECFTEGKNGMLESSDLSGRVAALLCASLSWILHCFKGLGVAKHVLYLCGTQQELSRAIEEFKKSKYASVRMVVINCTDDFKALFARPNYSNDDQDNDRGKKTPVPSIIFCTQELFFQELTVTIISAAKCDFQNTIILLDDASQVEEACCLSSSLSLCKVDRLIKQLQDFKDSEEIISKLDGIRKVFRCISPHNGNPYDPVFTEAEIMNVFENYNANINEEDASFLKELKNLDFQEVLHFMALVKIFTCQGIKTENYPQAINMYATETSAKSKFKTGHQETCQVACKTLHCVCWDSSFLFKIIADMKPHSILFSGTTISPFNHFKAELGVLEAKEFVGKCVIEDYQLFARIVMCGSGGQFLESTNSECMDPDYKTCVGKTILDVAKVTPAGQGMTIYFSSDNLFEQLKEHWHRTVIKGQSLWNLIRQEKEILSYANKDDLRRFNADSGLKTGHCIFAVLQTNDLMELINVSVNLDCHRIVMFIGVPFPSKDDPKVTLKKRFISEQCLLKKSKMTVSQFTTRETYKSVRRVVDHIFGSIYDYAMILLCDCQYDRSELSPWIKSKVHHEKRFAEMLHEIHDFFKTILKRTQSIMAPAENLEQRISQFGNVRTWEIEKVQLEVRKLRKKNRSLEDYVQRLKNLSEDYDKTNEDLEKKLKDMNVETIQMPHFSEMQWEASEVGGEGGKVLSPVNSPIKLLISPRKRPYPEDVK
ncbi:regulator of telomere elongation helicase 1 homolog isoform X2 [Thrips palmi]|uniref:Regulator of telomere elongation helicase 1 homolog isoform X2 n=1 Tax=Thrips palmi TaxID=161013 RepID=A0A6P8YAQ6_THRPL|nr:regulator of telomere elongation helicase 1 homolog isoform X2 [Thrips palmi]